MTGWRSQPTARARASAIAALAVVVVALAGASEARAAACCLSTASFGVGRLAIWEVAAVGVSTSAATDRGQWNPAGRWGAFPTGYQQDEARAELWTLLRLHERLQLHGRAPWVVGIRAAEGVGTSTGQGLGDVQVGLRWDALLLGEFLSVPGVALTATATVPTAVRAEAARDPLGASATGRGAWAAALALAVERSVIPYFLRLDAAISQPFAFERVDLGKTQRFGRGAQVGLAAGREVFGDRVVLATQATLEWEGAYLLDGVERAETSMRGLSLALSAALKLSPTWTVTAAANTTAASSWIGGHNRTERWSVTVGLRRGVQE